MGIKYFHYTSRHLAQEIIISGFLRPASAVGRIYLTQDTFKNGAEAAAKLSILGKPVEVVCVIPEDKVKDKIENKEPKVVDPIIGPGGKDLRPGGGKEYFTRKEETIDVADLHWYELPMP
jgi:hypothetical protein